MAYHVPIDWDESLVNPSPTDNACSVAHIFFSITYLHIHWIPINQSPCLFIALGLVLALSMCSQEKSLPRAFLSLSRERFIRDK